MSALEELQGPVARYRHDHPPVRNPLAEHEEQLSLGQRVADRVAAAVGSWPFIIIQSVLLAIWIGVNVYLVTMVATHPGFLKAWDPYPFILLNLVLSFQAAYTGPVVMMSQNRSSQKDRLMAQHDYEINLKSEREIQVVMEHLAHQDRLLLDAMQRLEALQLPPAAHKIDELLQRMEVNDRRILSLLEKLDAGQPSEPPTPA